MRGLSRSAVDWNRDGRSMMKKQPFIVARAVSHHNISILTPSSSGGSSLMIFRYGEKECSHLCYGLPVLVLHQLHQKCIESRQTCTGSPSGLLLQLAVWQHLLRAAALERCASRRESTMSRTTRTRRWEMRTSRRRAMQPSLRPAPKE